VCKCRFVERAVQKKAQSYWAREWHWCLHDCWYCTRQTREYFVRADYASPGSWCKSSNLWADICTGFPILIVVFWCLYSVLSFILYFSFVLCSSFCLCLFLFLALCNHISAKEITATPIPASPVYVVSALAKYWSPFCSGVLSLPCKLQFLICRTTLDMRVPTVADPSCNTRLVHVLTADWWAYGCVLTLLWAIKMCVASAEDRRKELQQVISNSCFSTCICQKPKISRRWWILSYIGSSITLFGTWYSNHEQSQAKQKLSKARIS